MPTLNLELNYFEHPKARKLRARLGDSADVLPLRLWCYVGQFCNKHDGVLVGHDDLEIEEIIRWKGKAGAAIEALIAVGFLERLPDGILKVHDWEEHSGHLAAFGLRAKAAAKARWDKAAHKGAETTEPEASGTERPVATPAIQKCLSNAQAMLGDATSNAHAVHAVHALHADVETTMSGKLPDAPPKCPHQDIIDQYHQFLPMMPRVQDWTEERQRMLATRWKENPERQKLEWWEGFFKYVAKSDFLCGRTKNPFLACNLEWLIRPRNFIKVVEGNYENERCK